MLVIVKLIIVLFNVVIEWESNICVFVVNVENIVVGLGKIKVGIF